MHVGRLNSLRFAQVNASAVETRHLIGIDPTYSCRKCFAPMPVPPPPLLLLLASAILSLPSFALSRSLSSGSSSSNGKFSRAFSSPAFPSTPLDAYVNAPDPSFSWVDTGITFSGAGWKGRVLNMSSQKW
jgi:hypothetical protein